MNLHWLDLSKLTHDEKDQLIAQIQAEHEEELDRVYYVLCQLRGALRYATKKEHGAMIADDVKWCMGLLDSLSGDRLDAQLERYKRATESA